MCNCFAPIIDITHTHIYLHIYVYISHFILLIKAKIILKETCPKVIHPTGTC